jgi:hypothetical protein
VARPEVHREVLAGKPSYIDHARPARGARFFADACEPDTEPGAERGDTVKIIYRISLSETQDADRFEMFIKARYLPAVHKRPTRTGRVTDLALWREVAETSERTHTFLVHLGFDGLPIGQLRVDDQEVQAAFEAFGATLNRLGAFDERVVWPEDTKS